MSAAAIIPSLMPLFVVIAMRRAEARIHQQLTDARAVSEESAIPLSIRRGMDRRRLQGLVQEGAVRVAANGHHYVDADGWLAYRKNRKRRAVIAVCIVVVLVGVVFALAYRQS